MPVLHELKTHSPQFKAIKSGRKQFELRKDDRGFKVGHELLLREYIPKTVSRPVLPKLSVSDFLPENDHKTHEIRRVDIQTGDYTGSVCHRRINYILRDYPGIEPGYAILGIEPI